MATQSQPIPRPIPLPLAEETTNPQREAAFFYGLFMRGHPLDQLRRDIDIPMDVLRRWHRHWWNEPLARLRFEKVLRHRRQVLAIFNTLVNLEGALSHLRQ